MASLNYSRWLEKLELWCGQGSSIPSRSSFSSCALAASVSDKIGTMSLQWYEAHAKDLWKLGAETKGLFEFCRQNFGWIDSWAVIKVDTQLDHQQLFYAIINHSIWSSHSTIHALRMETPELCYTIPSRVYIVIGQSQPYFILTPFLPRLIGSDWMNWWRWALKTSSSLLVTQ